MTWIYDFSIPDNCLTVSINNLPTELEVGRLYNVYGIEDELQIVEKELQINVIKKAKLTVTAFVLHEKQTDKQAKIIFNYNVSNDEIDFGNKTMVQHLDLVEIISKNGVAKEIIPLVCLKIIDHEKEIIEKYMAHYNKPITLH